MTVYVLPADNQGCGHYRIIWPAMALFNQGYKVRMLPPGIGGVGGVVIEDQPNGTRILRRVELPGDTEVLVLQRPANELFPQLIRMAKDAGVAVVVDMDDDMSTIHQRNVAYDYYSKRVSNGASWQFAAESCKLATLVTTSTRKLQSVYAKHGRGAVLDNYVPEAYLSYEREHTGLFGWPGQTGTHPDDVQQAGEAIRRLVAESFGFATIGGPSKTQEALRLEKVPINIGPVGTDNWARHIARVLEVGIAPLAPNMFNQAKSRLKVIEMMAVGVPWVSSPREEYRKVRRESGAGFLADTTKQWYSQLKELLTNERLREEQAQAGKAYMQGQTYEANAWRWAEAWERARGMR